METKDKKMQDLKHINTVMTLNIYIIKRNKSLEKIMCLHALEIMFCKCLLVDFKLMWNVNELN